MLTDFRNRSPIPPPPPASDSALRYIHEIGLRLGLHLPAAYVELLTIVNGFSTQTLTIYGANIATNDLYKRIDIVQGHTALGKHHHHGDTIYGHTADAFLAYLASPAPLCHRRPRNAATPQHP